MAWWKRQNFGMHVFVSLVAGFVIGVSAEVLADTVYTWTTDDGTVAFTDEDKRVPARYRDRVETRTMQGLSSYERYTPVEGEVAAVATDAPVGAAVATELPAQATLPAVSAPPPGVSIVTGGSRYGNDGVIVPTNAPVAGEEPVVIERVRVQRPDSQATTHETVVRQGDRVISIRRDESSHRDGSGMVPPLD